MNIVREIILNQLIKIPAIKAKAKKYHQTGLSHNPDLIEQTYQSFIKYSSVENKDILELGAGKTAQIILKAKAQGASSVTIADIETYLSEKEIADNKINYVIYEGKHIPLPDESFDLIWSNDVYEHIRFPKDVVKETFRLLRPSGMIVHIIDLSDHFSYGKNKPELSFNCLKYPEWLWEMMTWNRSNYVNRLRASEWVELHKWAGFEIVEAHTKPNEYIKENLRKDNSLKYLLKLPESDAVSGVIHLAARKPLIK